MLSSRKRLFNITILLLAFAILLVIALSATGVLDPGPTGSLAWTSRAQQVMVPSDSTVTNWLEADVPGQPFSALLIAAYRSGEIDSGYGLLLGHPEDSLAIGLSPLGYVAIWRQQEHEIASPDTYLLPWQPWPHVRTGPDPNEILVTLENNQLRIFINREWLWEGEMALQPKKIGLIGASFGDAATIDFSEVSLYTD
jgi:hypothetical protein